MRQISRLLLRTKPSMLSTSRPAARYTILISTVTDRDAPSPSRGVGVFRQRLLETAQLVVALRGEDTLSTERQRQRPNIAVLPRQLDEVCVDGLEPIERGDSCDEMRTSLR